MPFIEFMLHLLAILFGLAMLGIMLYYGSIALLIVAGVNIVVGWIPILAVLSDETWHVSFGGNFMEAWAAWSLLLYGIIAAAIAIIWLSISSGGDLPNGLKVIAWLFPHPAAREVSRGTQRSLIQDIHGTSLNRALADEPSTALGRRVQRHQADKLTKDLEAEKEWLDGQTNIARAAEETEVARAEVRATKDALSKGDVDPDAIKAYAARLRNQ